MLKQRVLTAIVGLPLVWAVFRYGPSEVVAIFFTLVVARAIHEVVLMLFPRLLYLVDPQRQEIKNTIVGRLAHVPRLSYLVAQISGLALFLLSILSAPDAGRGIMILSFLGIILAACFLSKSNEEAMANTFGYLLTLCYAVLPWLALWELYRLHPHNPAAYLFLILAIVWSGDTGAYFGGRFWGKHALAPKMSPKKTWEGAVTGALASMLAAWLLNAVYGKTLGHDQVILIIGLIGGIIGQLGDLVESSIKRFCQVKDSGQIFPGHGGLLDRVDGLIFAAPVVWFGLYFFGIS